MRSSPLAFNECVFARGCNSCPSLKSETSPFGNPVSPCEAGDAGVGNKTCSVDPSGVAHQ